MNIWPFGDQRCPLFFCFYVYDPFVCTLIPTCKSQRPLFSGPGLPVRFPCLTRRERPPSASPVRPADPALFERWTRSPSDPGRPFLTGPSSPPLSGLRLGHCLRPTEKSKVLVKSVQFFFFKSFLEIISKSMVYQFFHPGYGTVGMTKRVGQSSGSIA